MVEREIVSHKVAIGLVLVCLLCLVAVIPLLRNDPPCTHDGTAHYYRVVALREALRQGLVFTRYLPDLAFGYGYPFFNYRAPLPYYLVLAFHGTGIGLPLAQNLTYVLGILGSAVAAFLLARDLFGPHAGLVAAVAYAYTPYQFLDALLRGNLPESMALALMPLALWAFRRLALSGGRRWLLVSITTLSGLYLSHNISSLLFTPFLVAFLLVLWLVYRRSGHWRAVGIALILALGLTAFFWGPALMERDYVQLHMAYSTRNNDFRHNFLPMDEVLSPPIPVDTSLMNPPIRVHVGLVQAMLAVLGLVLGLVRWRDRERPIQLVLLALVGVAFMWMSTRASMPLWEQVPLLRFVQFPWRFVGRAALPISLLAGASAEAILSARAPGTCPNAGAPTDAARSSVRTSAILSSALIVIIVVAAFPYAYPPMGYCPRASRPDINDLFRFESRHHRAGLAASGSFFPVWVRQRPDGSPLQDQYATDGPVARFDTTALPEGARIVEASYAPNRARIVVDTPTPFAARYLSFFFPGWRVQVDGELTPITPSDPEGIISFHVPAGLHTVEVRFGETPLRSAFDAVSALSFLSLIPALLLTSTPGVYRQPDHLRAAAIYLTLVSTALLPILKVIVVDPMPTPVRQGRLRPDGSLRGVQNPLNQPYDDGLALIGYDRSAETLSSDGTLRVDLYWTALQKPTRRYQTVVHLVGPDGSRWSPKDSYRPTDFQDPPPTTAWLPGTYALDSHELAPLAGTPPGTYDVVLTVFDRDSLAPLSVLDEAAQPAAPDLVLGQVDLSVPFARPEIDDLEIPQRLDWRLGPLTLLGITFSREGAAPGDPVLANTFWRAETRPSTDLELQLTLRTADGSPVASYVLPPSAEWHPTTAWQSGAILRGQHELRLPADLEDGEYGWHLSLLPIQRSTGLPDVLDVEAPERIFTQPAVDAELDAQIGEAAMLVGASFEPASSLLTPGETLTVTLVWQAESAMATSYHVFLHLVGRDGRLVAQTDGIPGGWSRPTTGWLPGEYIADVHVLALPAETPSEQHTLYAGLYVPGGARLTTPDGADAVQVRTIALRE